MKKKIQLLIAAAILVCSCQTFAQDAKPKKEKKPKEVKTQPVSPVKFTPPVIEKNVKKEKHTKTTTVTTTPAVKPVVTPVVTPVKTKPVTPVVNPKNTAADPVIGTDAKGRTIYQGKRGGKYYLTANGNREYIKQ